MRARTLHYRRRRCRRHRRHRSRRRWKDLLKTICKNVKKVTHRHCDCRVQIDPISDFRYKFRSNKQIYCFSPFFRVAGFACIAYTARIPGTNSTWQLPRLYFAHFPLSSSFIPNDIRRAIIIELCVFSHHIYFRRRGTQRIAHERNKKKNNIKLYIYMKQTIATNNLSKRFDKSISGDGPLASVAIGWYTHSHSHSVLRRLCMGIGYRVSKKHCEFAIIGEWALNRSNEYIQWPFKYITFREIRIPFPRLPLKIHR